MSVFRELLPSFERLRSSSGETNPSDEPQPEQPTPLLFRCPSCDTVYVAVEKSSCRGCDTAVDRVTPASAES